ncbi:glycosyltransferase family 4 protein [Spirosoma validum]|uniref:Glycosyltransferase family 4 protein n=1 Tax=Spirosoma validum TaxID=2771355 RepID=A0A927GC09_9BACT|nr:glycosyltransferase family 1 protein [Spirosoma validum]MBD2751961.1 glycosyltransferase family 4 protein [Spirosoma validum]
MPRLLLETERMANLTSGLGQLCLHLGRELVRQKPPDWEITFLVTRDQVGIFGPSVKYRIATRLGRVWRFWNYDIWHCLYQDTRFYPTLSTRFIYTILDLNYLALKQYSVQRREKRKEQYQARINQARTITTISQYVAKDVQQQLSVPAQTPIDVIYCGVDIPDNVSISPPIVKPKGPFLFFIGMLQSYKNVHTMLPLLVSNPSYWLVLAGPDKPEYSQLIWEQARQLGVADRLLMPGPIDESTKWWFYTHCEAFLFPSLMEGFGIPVIEAMSFGKPVFSSPLTSLPEVGGSEAFYFPSFDAETVNETFKKGMQAYRNDPMMADRLRLQSQKFRWEIAASEYWQLYQTLMRSS